MRLPVPPSSSRILATKDQATLASNSLQTYEAQSVSCHETRESAPKGYFQSTIQTTPYQAEWSISGLMDIPRPRSAGTGRPFSDGSPTDCKSCMTKLQPSTLSSATRSNQSTYGCRSGRAKVGPLLGSTTIVTSLSRGR